MNGEFQRFRVLWPLVPAMAMVMIDFTIVSISASTIAGDLHLSETAVQWLVTAYALSTAAFVALGGKLGDILGHRSTCIAGIVICIFLMGSCVPDIRSVSEPLGIIGLVICAMALIRFIKQIKDGDEKS